MRSMMKTSARVALSANAAPGRLDDDNTRSSVARANARTVSAGTLPRRNAAMEASTAAHRAALSQFFAESKLA